MSYVTLFSAVILVSIFSGIAAKGDADTDRSERFLYIPDAVSDFVRKTASVVQKVPKQIQSFFYPPNNNNNNNADIVAAANKEHGQWDFFGREWLKGLGKTIDNIGSKFGHSGSSGLDTLFSGYARFDFIKEVRAIVPGTRFCGQGDVAGESRELGYFNDTDSCCKQHDGCFESILPGETLHGLENTGLFTRSRCECDARFYNCLKNVGGVLATKIGFTFFTVLGPQCFNEDYPVVKCAKTSWGRCLAYEVDKTQEKRTQWFDNPIY